MDDTDETRWDAIPFVRLLQINPFNNVTLYHETNGYTSEVQRQASFDAAIGKVFDDPPSAESVTP